MTILEIVIILIVLGLLFGGYGTTRDGWGLWGWSPFGLIVLIVLVLWLTGALH